MVITGSALFIEPGSDQRVIRRLSSYPGVTFQVQSETGTELVVNMEAEDLDALERLGAQLKHDIPEIVDISHICVNFEEEIAKIEAGEVDKHRLAKPKFFES